MPPELNYSSSKAKHFLLAKPSELLEIALEDLRQASEDEAYEIKMAAWHEYHTKTDKCCVCLAGSVLAFTLSCPREAQVELCDFSTKVKSRLTAINLLRTGDVEEAFRLLKISQDDGAKLNRRIVSYRDEPKQAVGEWGKLAQDLKRLHF